MRVVVAVVVAMTMIVVMAVAMAMTVVVVVVMAVAVVVVMAVAVVVVESVTSAWHWCAAVVVLGDHVHLGASDASGSFPRACSLQIPLSGDARQRGQCLFDVVNGRALERATHR
jgi:hypothetical protein